MPANVFPRNDLWLPIGVTDIVIPAGRRTITKSGIVQTRGSTTVGFAWQETYPRLFARNPDIERFLSWIRWARNSGGGQEFSIQHPLKPGSGVAPNGTGSAGVTVSGASQTGSSLVTTGWPLSTSNVSRAGDLISIAGIQRTFEVTDDASSDGSGNATLSVSPAIYTAPSNGAAVTTTDVNINAVIMEINNASIQDAFYYTGLQISFREAP